MSTKLDEIDARVRDCQTYNFGMRNADRLAHVDAPEMSAALRAVLDLHQPHDKTGKCIECTAAPYSMHSVRHPCPTVLAITAHLPMKEGK